MVTDRRPALPSRRDIMPLMGFWAALTAGWRSSRNVQLRRPVYKAYSADGYFTQLVDFVEMQVLEHFSSPDPTPGVASWPTLQNLRRLDAVRWEVRPHPTYLEHRVADLRGRGFADPSSLLQSERAELEQLLSGNVPWKEWGWGGRIEPAYQQFLRHYRQAADEDVARRDVSSLENRYLRLWQSEAERVGSFSSTGAPGVQAPGPPRA